jgi:hypothetical protein
MDHRPQPAPAAVEDRGVNAEHRLVGRDLRKVRQVRWVGRRQVRGIGQPLSGERPSGGGPRPRSVQHRPPVCHRRRSSQSPDPYRLPSRGRLLASTGDPRPKVRVGLTSPATGPTRLHPARPARRHPHPSWVVRAGGAGRLAGPRFSAPAFAAVAQRVFVAQASFGSGSQSQILLSGVGGHAGAEPAEREQEALPRVATGGLAGWDSARRVHPRSMGAVTPSRCGGCRSVSMSFPAARWSPNRSSRSTSVPTPGGVRPMLVTVGTGGSAAREARPGSTGVELPGDCTAIARERREPAFGR